MAASDTNQDNNKHIYLVDGSSFIFRAYHALPPMNSPDGTPVNAVYGFSNMLFKLLQDVDIGDQPSHFAVLLDKGRITFRNDFYPEYKAHRPPAPEDLVPQFPLIRKAVEAFNVPVVEMEGYEADDLIATYAKQARERGWRVTIVSSDKDLMQLIDERTIMLDSMKNRHMSFAEVEEKFGVGPDRVIDVQSLAGDSVDNVPGVPGIGLKTAALLINEYGDLDTLLARASEIKQKKRRENLIEFADQARISRDLVTLKQDTPVETGLDDLALRPMDVNVLVQFIETYGFRSLKSKVISHLGPADELEGDAAGAVSQLQAEFVVKETDYQCIQEMDDLDAWIRAIEMAGHVTVDTETTSLNAMSARLVGICLSIEAGKACYIPLRHKAGDGDGGFDLLDQGPKQLDAAKVLAKLKPVFENPAILKVGQNIKYDMIILRHEGIILSPIDDTMLMSYALEGGAHGHGMDELADLHLGHQCIAFKDVVGTGKSQITFDQVPLEKATDYAAEDADITGRLGRLLKPRLASEKVATVYERLERPLVPVLADMEYKGIKVDKAMLNRLSMDFSARLEELEKIIYQLAGEQFNIGSPKQLGEILFDKLGLEGGKKSKKGARSTNHEVLEALAAEGHELPEKILEWRMLSKLRSTYTDSLQKVINDKTGRVHTSYAQALTSTGRLSSSDPNLQNIPIRTEEGRKIRQAFVPEAGYKLLAADYSQIELRLLAHIADIEALKTAFHQGHDIHAMTASEVFGVPMEGMDPIVRRQAKAINFGIIYGISAFGLARQLGISRTEAKDYIAAYFEKFPGIRHYMDDTIEFAKKHGYVETVFGRKCHLPALLDKNPMRRSFGERAAINAPIQGSAADVIRRAMIQMPEALENNGLTDVKMLLQVHDELVFEVPEDKLEKAQSVITKTMENAASPILNISVPLVVDCGTGNNWDEAH